MVFASLLVTFREALEASLIVTIVSAYLKKIGRTDLNRYLFAGSLLAVLASLALGFTVQLTYRGLQEFKGAAVEVFEGTAALTATAVLTYMVFWMGRNARRIRHEIEHRVDVAVSRGQTFGIFALAFVAVVREGIETVLFLTVFFVTDPSGTAIGITLGVGTVLLLVMLLLKGTYRLDVRKFFKYSSVLLVILAAGLAGYGTHEFIEASESSGLDFGVLSRNAFDVNPSRTNDIFHEEGTVGSILRALVGYDGNPEWLRVIVYLSYWTVIGAYLLRTYRPVHLLQQ